MDIYGHFHILHHGIHYVTFVGIVILGLVYLYRFRTIKVSSLLRLLYPLLYVSGAVIHYEIIWNFGWALYWPFAYLDVIGFIICEVMIFYAIGLMKRKFGYNIPQIHLFKFSIVTTVMLILILCLYSTGFYQIYTQVHLQQTTIDPHNFIWAVGKLFCLLSWVFITDYDGLLSSMITRNWGGLT